MRAPHRRRHEWRLLPGPSAQSAAGRPSRPGPANLPKKIVSPTAKSRDASSLHLWLVCSTRATTPYPHITPAPSLFRARDEAIQRRITPSPRALLPAAPAPMPSAASYLLVNPSKSFSFHRLSPPFPSPRLPARRLHVSCDAPRGSSRSGGGGGRREVIPAGASKAKKQIVFFDAAPPVSQSQQGGDEEGKRRELTKDGKDANAALALARRATKRTLAVLSNLPLAISEMFAIAALMALGTVIDQGEAPSYYFEKFPEDNPVFGFITWRWILTPGFDHMFSSPVFLGLLALLAASLMACTYTTQLPMVKVARRWSFTHSGERIRKQEFADSLPRASIQDLGVILMGAGYEVFTKGPSLYAFKGLAGRYAPIGVHLAMLFIMAGATLSATGSFKGSVDVPQGLNFVIGDVMKPRGVLSVAPDDFNTEVHVNRFYMEYYDSGEVSQFYSDLSLFDLDGKEVMRKTIKVNDPLRYGGVTIYQTDWGFSALSVKKNGEGPFNLAMAPLKLNGDKKLFGTFLPLEDSNSSNSNVKGISMLARDLQSIVLYDQDGKFVGVRRPSSKLPIEINGNEILIEDAIGSTGLDLKTDPGVPIVYAGFGALMLTTCISYLSHSQIWALQDGSTVVVGGKTNRAKLEFSEEMNRLLDKVPELIGANENAVDSKSTAT
ncbi:cytochrome c biogenesis protein CCS1, chloroplastic [Phragmites australis]|uniref:cytochrome c biogenesis protein CCS1, chloroplastic n=1 Tax=Phragmites australis TaxID=29695 RepID=UPI002D7853C7|nr:cytochrome c biogenesis protein CCS1, chloroplastic [Phragmites australis]